MLTWHRGDFRAGASSFGIPLMALYLFTWYDHKMSGQRETPRYEISQRYRVKATRPPVSAWNRSAGRLERVAYALCFRFWITRVCYQHGVYLQITRYEMTQSTCKRDTKSKSHPSIKLAPVRVFSCEHPLRWLTAAKNANSDANVSWLLNFRIRLFMRSAVILHAVSEWWA